MQLKLGQTCWSIREVKAKTCRKNGRSYTYRAAKKYRVCKSADGKFLLWKLMQTDVHRRSRNKAFEDGEMMATSWGYQDVWHNKRVTNG